MDLLEDCVEVDAIRNGSPEGNVDHVSQGVCNLHLVVGHLGGDILFPFLFEEALTMRSNLLIFPPVDCCAEDFMELKNLLLHIPNLSLRGTSGIVCRCQ